ncbi:MOSC domain-containing protein [Actinoplanes sp. NPDC051861]|uniref:MOSC domain-containing protein n=1 Tax=Actinoplanes sp. NPDC051861 TaxID=3155170 RepID=UPI00342F6513
MSAEQGTVAAVSCNDEYTFTKPNRDEIVLVAGLGVSGDVHAGVHVRHRHRVKLDPGQPNLRQVHLIQAELFEEVAGKGYAVPPGGLGENVTTRGIDLLGLPRGTILRFGRTRADGAPADGAPADGGLGGGSRGAGASGSAPGAVAGVLAAARAATLDEATARAAAAVEAAAARDEAAATARAAAGDEVDGDARAAVVVTGLRNPCAQINGFRAGLLKEMVGHDGEGNVVRKAGVMAVVLRGGVVRPGDPVSIEFPPGEGEPLELV